MTTEEIIYGTECKHWEDCDFRNGLDCDSEMCEEFELDNGDTRKDVK